jgi:rod shape-determining protein MreD
MKPTVWHRLDLMARKATPFAVTFLLVLLNAIPVGLPAWGRIAPVLPLIGVYHWAVHRPELLPGALVFVIGLIHDALNGLPLGLHAVVFLAVHGTVVVQRRFLIGKSFRIQWLGFLLVAVAAAPASWALASLYALRLIGVDAVLYQHAITVGIYPAVAWILLRWQQTVLRPE